MTRTPPPRFHGEEVIPRLEAAKALLEDFAPQFAAETLSYVRSAGTDNVMVRVGQSAVLRLPRYEDMTDAVAREVHALKVFSGRIPVPRILAEIPGNRHHRYPVLLLEWTAGRSLDNGPDAQEHLAVQLAPMLQSIHGTDPADWPTGDRPLRDHDPEVQSFLDQMTDHPRRNEIMAAWSAALTLPEFEGPLLPTHGDLAPGNIVQSPDGDFTLIDWSATGLADPATDLRIAWTYFDPTHRARFQASLSIEPATWSRARARALAQAIKQWPYYKNTNETLWAQADKTLAACLDDR